MSSLTLDRVSKVYDPGTPRAVRAVDTVEMTVEDGEIVGLLGSSGCGKTSALRMIAGFEDVTEGEIRLGDRRLNDLLPARRNIAMAFEGYALYPPLRVRDNIGFALLRDRHPKAEVEARVNEIAELLEITDILDRFPPTISAGQQQRTSLARALIRSAGAFLLDEPMSQLEPQLRGILRARIKDWLITRKMTTVFVTHDQTEAMALADRIAVMEKGVLQQLATPADLRDAPANLFVASFIGEPPMNIFKAQIIDEPNGLAVAVLNDRGADRLSIPLPAHLRSLKETPDVFLGIRAHRVLLGDGPSAVAGTVISNHWLGDQTHLGIDIGGSTLIVVAHSRIAAPAGAQIPVQLPVGCMHLFDAASEKVVFHGGNARAAAA